METNETERKLVDDLTMRFNEESKKNKVMNGKITMR